jgi:hypothetical protein
MAHKTEASQFMLRNRKRIAPTLLKPQARTRHEFAPGDRTEA